MRPKALLFDLGNALPPRGQGDLKIPFLLRAEASLEPVATLFNVLEMDQVPAIQSHLANGKGGLQLPYLLSNLTEASEARRPNWLRTSIRTQGDSLVVLGYTAPSSVGTGHGAVPTSLGVEGFTPTLAERWRRLLGSAKPATSGSMTKMRVLLFSGPDQDLKAIATAKLFDLVISSSPEPLATEPTGAERHQAALLERRRSVAEQAILPVYAVPLGGTGLLRGGSLRDREAKSVSQILAGAPNSQPSPCREPGGGTAFLAKFPDGPCSQLAAALAGPAVAVTWLEPAAAPTLGPLTALYEEYQAATRRAFKASSDERAQALVATPFAGSAACTSCHPNAAKAYGVSHHARAFFTLKAKGKDQDGECVACHVLGAKATGGFVSEAESPQFAHVQCENCHGPRLSHARSPGPPVDRAQSQAAAKAACSQCHTPQHSPHFDFSVYWPRIAHGI